MSESQTRRQLFSRRQRLRIWRFAANFMLLWILPVVVVVNLVRWLVPSIDQNLLVVLWIPFGLAMVVMAIPWFLSQCGFMWGFIKCPDCTGRYASGFNIYIKPVCVSCGADMRQSPSVVTSNISLQADRER